MTSVPVPPKRLRWRCRRGTKELDRMLVSFLETCWPQLDEAQHEAFERLLDQEDDELIDWLISGREGPPDAAIRDVVERIRKHMGL